MSSPPPSPPRGTSRRRRRRRRRRSAYDVRIRLALVAESPELVVSGTHTFRMTPDYLEIIENVRKIDPPDYLFLDLARAEMNQVFRPLKRKREGDDDGNIHRPKRRRSKWMTGKLRGVCFRFSRVSFFARDLSCPWGNLVISSGFSFIFGRWNSLDQIIRRKHGLDNLIPSTLPFKKKTKSNIMPWLKKNNFSSQISLPEKKNIS